MISNNEEALYSLRIFKHCIVSWEGFDDEVGDEEEEGKRKEMHEKFHSVLRVALTVK